MFNTFPDSLGGHVEFVRRELNRRGEVWLG